MGNDFQLLCVKLQTSIVVDLAVFFGQMVCILSKAADCLLPLSCFLPHHMELEWLEEDPDALFKGYRYCTNCSCWYYVGN